LKEITTESRDYLNIIEMKKYYKENPEVYINLEWKIEDMLNEANNNKVR
jgi:hypothetical protein